MIDIVKLFEHYKIRYWTHGKNVHAGWIQTTCPFCDDTANHLGFNLHGNYFNCWKCNWHPIDETLSKILRKPKSEIYKILKHFNKQSIQRDKLNKVKHEVKSIKLIGGKLEKIHKDYLESRKFDPEFLEKKYELKGTNHIGDYKFRVVAPIFFRNELVSYQARDVTGQHELRYKALAKSKEIIHHKHTLYNFDNCRSNSIILVEGITDVWRIGDDCACTFGTGFTTNQVRLLRDYKRVFTLYDPEPAAQKKCMTLAETLSIMGVEVKNIKLKDVEDPGALSEDDAKHLKKELIG